MARSILIVEDNPSDLELALHVFERRKLADQIHVARDGEEALAWLKRWEVGEPPPTVVLLDLDLPRVSGLEVLKQFREHSLGRLLPLVVLTSSDEASDIRSAYRLGANSYVIKPVSFERFSAVVAQIAQYWGELNQTC